MKLLQTIGKAIREVNLKKFETLMDQAAVVTEMLEDTGLPGAEKLAKAREKLASSMKVKGYINEAAVTLKQIDTAIHLALFIRDALKGGDGEDETAPE